MKKDARKDLIDSDKRRSSTGKIPPGKPIPARNKTASAKKMAALDEMEATFGGDLSAWRLYRTLVRWSKPTVLPLRCYLGSVKKDGSPGKLAEETRLSPATIKRARKRLRDDYTLVTWLPRNTLDGRDVNEYYVSLPGFCEFDVEKLTITKDGSIETSSPLVNLTRSKGNKSPLVNLTLDSSKEEATTGTTGCVPVQTSSSSSRTVENVARLDGAQAQNGKRAEEEADQVERRDRHASGHRQASYAPPPQPPHGTASVAPPATPRRSRLAQPAQQGQDGGRAGEPPPQTSPLVNLTSGVIPDGCPPEAKYLLDVPPHILRGYAKPGDLDRFGFKVEQGSLIGKPLWYPFDVAEVAVAS